MLKGRAIRQSREFGGEDGEGFEGEDSREVGAKVSSTNADAISTVLGRIAGPFIWFDRSFVELNRAFVVVTGASFSFGVAFVGVAEGGVRSDLGFILIDGALGKIGGGWDRFAGELVRFDGGTVKLAEAVVKLDGGIVKLAAMAVRVSRTASRLTGISGRLTGAPSNLRNARGNLTKAAVSLRQCSSNRTGRVGRWGGAVGSGVVGRGGSGISRENASDKGKDGLVGGVVGKIVILIHLGCVAVDTLGNRSVVRGRFGWRLSGKNSFQLRPNRVGPSVRGPVPGGDVGEQTE